MKEMYKGKVNSPATLLVETIDSSVTSIKVADGNVFPEGPNVAVIGTDGNAETIKYDSINGNILVGCVRGFQGKASVWDKDTIIARNFTEYDLDALQENILELDNNKVEKINGKTLSTNDFTNEEKNKLANIEAEANKYEHPSTHSASMITETSSKRFVSDTEKQNWNNKIDKSQITDEYYGDSQDKVISQKGVTELGVELGQELNELSDVVHQQMATKSEIPTKVSQLVNDKNFKTEAEIQSLINNSTKLKKGIVTSLPSSGKEDIIYLLKNKNDTNNVYTEYMWISGKWEIIGDTKVDLSEYLKTVNLRSATLRTNKNNINVFTDRSTSDHQLGIILGDLELRTEQNKKNIELRAKSSDIKTKLSEMIEDSTHRTVTDSEKEKWNNIKNAEVVDNLTTDDATKALSAKQGKALQNNKADKSDISRCKTKGYNTSSVWQSLDSTRDLEDWIGDFDKRTRELKEGSGGGVEKISLPYDAPNEITVYKSGRLVTMAINSCTARVLARLRLELPYSARPIEALSMSVTEAGSDCLMRINGDGSVYFVNVSNEQARVNQTITYISKN